MVVHPAARARLDPKKTQKKTQIYNWASCDTPQ